jgi:hypothetical protein
MIPNRYPPEAQPANDLHLRFLVLLPQILTHARITFSFIPCPHQRDDKVQESVALAWKWFLRLTERGKNVNDFIITFCRLVVRAVKAGRQVCGMYRSKDILNPLAQRRFRFQVERLPQSIRCSADSPSHPNEGHQQDALAERLQDNTITPVPDQVIFRIDWPQFFQTLSPRDRGLTHFLGMGHSNKMAARKFKLSPGRVTQLRQQWCRQWRIFQGDVADKPAPVSS